MKIHHPLLLLLAAATQLHAVATVTNVRAAQIPGKHQVRITYDLAAAAPCTVGVQATKDGAAVSIPNAAQAFQGDGVGATVSPGTGKSITLTVQETDNPVVVTALQNTYTKNLRFKILATENAAPPTLDGFSLIPAGSFQMGDQSNPLVGYTNELPVHEVYVSAFYMAKYEVTKELWDEVRAWGMANGRGYTDLAAGNGSYASKGANHPVHSISWNDMVKWCNARSEKENLTPCYTVSGAVHREGQSTPDCNWSANGYRLPTEAEWEKAARGGQTGLNFPWGNTITHSQANYYSSASYSYDVSPTRGWHPTWSNNPNTGSYPYSSPVGSFAPNGYGLYDMVGNMWEWCWDWYSSNYYASSPGAEPRGPTSGSRRVIRGGSWDSNAIRCRAANRNSYYPAYSYYNFGFRPARSSVP